MKEKQNNSKANYVDIVKPSQIYYGMKSRFAEATLDISFDKVEKAIIEKLNSLCIDENSYQAYVEYLTKELEKIETSKRKEREVFNLQINKLTHQKNDFIKKMLGKELSEDEQKAYNEKLAEFNRDIEITNSEASKIVIEERNLVVEFEAMVDIIRRA
jgi:superoxide dismutase